MTFYIYNGQISPGLRGHILANAQHFEKVMAQSVAAFGGRLNRCFVTAQSIDPIGFLEFPDDIAARAWNAYYASQEGLRRSTIERLLETGDLCEMGRIIGRSAPEAEKHRGADHQTAG